MSDSPQRSNPSRVHLELLSIFLKLLYQSGSNPSRVHLELGLRRRFDLDKRAPTPQGSIWNNYAHGLRALTKTASTPQGSIWNHAGYSRCRCPIGLFEALISVDRWYRLFAGGSMERTGNE